jgi:hypothetical protein
MRFEALSALADSVDHIALNFEQRGNSDRADMWRARAATFGQ